MAIATEPDRSGPLSWRDVYKAVGDSEERVLKAIDLLRERIVPIVNDHETRIREMEKGGAGAAHESRLKAVERSLSLQEGEQSGARNQRMLALEVLRLLFVAAGAAGAAVTVAHYVLGF